MVEETVDVCIPTCNQAQYLELAINSVLEQTHPVSNIFVADDASDDSTAEILRKTANSKVQTFRHENRLGIAGNVDFVLRKATSRYVIRLDSDDTLMPNYVERMVEAFKRYPTAGAFHCDVNEIDATGLVRRCRINKRAAEFQSPEEALKALPFSYGVTANICGFRRDGLSSVNYTRGRPNYLEDYDLWARLADAGFGNVYYQTVLANYRVWKSASRVGIERKAMELEGLVRLFDETLVPAYLKRNWDTTTIRRARVRHALHQCAYLAETSKSPQRTLIDGLLKILGENDWRIRSAILLGNSSAASCLLFHKSLRERAASTVRQMRRTLTTLRLR